MAWVSNTREISKEDYEAITSGAKKLHEFFSEAELVGYGAIPRKPYEKDGKYYIPYGISTSCD